MAHAHDPDTQPVLEAARTPQMLGPIQPDPDSYSATVAPYPEREADVTADALIRHLTAEIVQRHTMNRDLYRRAFKKGTADVRDRATFAAWSYSLTVVAAEWALVHALRTANATDPAAADQMARQLWSGWEFGDGVQDAWDWAAEAGINPGRIEAEEQQAIAEAKRATTKAGACRHPLCGADGAACPDCGTDAATVEGTTSGKDRADG